MGAICGFTGPPQQQQAAQMAAALSHRGNGRIESHAHRHGTISRRDAHRPWCLGLVPAALHHFERDDLTIALCGFVTSVDDQELAGLANQDQQPQATEFYHCLARRYRERGPSAIAALHGAFIVCVRDRDRFFLSRDGTGNRTIFYGRCGQQWLFGIEPKAITAVPAFARSIRPAALAQYLACSFVPGTGTMLNDLFEVPAGTTITLKTDAEPQLDRWFRFEEEEPRKARAESADRLHRPSCNARSLHDDEWVKSFRAEMARAVAERIPRGQPVGVFLSGGLDSSIVTAELAQQLGGKNVRTWALHFGPKYHHELAFAREVADRCGTVHEEVELKPRQFASRLRRMIWHLDDPIGDPITQPNFELAAHASREVGFIFNGEGGDPCFGGPKNLPMMLHHWYGGLHRDANFREQQYLRSYRRAWEEIEYLLTPEWRQQIDVERDLVGIFKPYLGASVPRLFLNRLTALNIREKGAHLIQPKVERMLAAHGMIPLAPLFDERLTRISFSMPTHMKLHRGVEKVILKRAYEHLLPKSVIDRPKSGMRVPVHYWFRSEMRRYAKRLLSRRSILQAGMFRPDRVKQLLRYDIEEGRGRYGLRLWMLMTFELWRRIVIERESV